MKIATWNVNSIRARQERVVSWVGTHMPDVLCLQETKVEDDKFPAEDYLALGYHLETFGQKAYNGVALLSRTPLSDVERGFADGTLDSQARFLAASTSGVRAMSIYVPNGEAVGSEKFAYKLAWLERLRAYLAHNLAEEPAALCGDYNVAPTDLDVYDPASWAGKVLCSEAERAALERVRSTGLIDAVRKIHPGERLYTWWDYRQLAFAKNRGLRIDHIWVTSSLAERAISCHVDREARKGNQPSDHSPVVAEFRD